MKLGIKTTGGVSKLKTKTTDGVVKAVECACCDPCGGLWGPGYDDWPDLLMHEGCGAFGRVSKCVWMRSLCTNGLSNPGQNWENVHGYYVEGQCPAGTEDSDAFGLVRRSPKGGDGEWLGYPDQELWIWEVALPALYDFSTEIGYCPSILLESPRTLFVKTDMSTPLGTYINPFPWGETRSITLT